MSDALFFEILHDVEEILTKSTEELDGKASDSLELSRESIAAGLFRIAIISSVRALSCDPIRLHTP